jgi:hypothetical protein
MAALHTLRPLAAGTAHTRTAQKAFSRTVFSRIDSARCSLPRPAVRAPHAPLRQPLRPPSSRPQAALSATAAASQTYCDESSGRTQQALRALTVAAAAVAAWCVLASALQGGNLFASLTLAATDNKGACP